MEQPFVRLALLIDNFSAADLITDVRIHTCRFDGESERYSVSKQQL
jgi:hypothetical protein